MIVLVLLFPVLQAKYWIPSELVVDFYEPSSVCKNLTFIRHAEGLHNIAERQSPLGSNVLRKEHSGDQFVDAILSPLGEQQSKALQSRLVQKHFDLIVVSPLRRTLQTASIAFEKHRVAFLAEESCREILDSFPCNQRHSISSSRADFPHVDFNGIEHDADPWFHSIQETRETIKERAKWFLNWLMTRQESSIAVVSHSEFLFGMFKLFPQAYGEYSNLHTKPLNAEDRHFQLCRRPESPTVSGASPKQEL
jgi:broad specificity phosphatase PhoE